MQDFNDFVKNGNATSNSNGYSTSGVNNDILKMVSALAGKFDGKSQTDLIKAIYEEAKRGKERGTLSNADIDNFVKMLSPMLDDKKRKMLNKIAVELKKI